MASALKLTAMAKAAGCAAKLNPATLEAVLRKLPRQTSPNVLVGFDTNDDAGVYLINKDLALVQTVDFFTPIVDDPFLFGQIAAANALSDVYAMGGQPISSLSVVGFPEHADPEILEQIIRGGLSKMNEANCSVLGGHSIRTEDMLFGYAVTGTIHPQKIWRNVGAQPGDKLIFTKPLGTGVITTALKKEQATPQSLQAAVTAMTTLNRATTAALLELTENVNVGSGGEARPIHAVTDVTGFGVLGHAREMALGDPVPRHRINVVRVGPHRIQLYSGSCRCGARRPSLWRAEKQSRVRGRLRRVCRKCAAGISGFALRSANLRRPAHRHRLRFCRRCHRDASASRRRNPPGRPRPREALAAHLCKMIRQ